MGDLPSVRVLPLVGALVTGCVDHTASSTTRDGGVEGDAQRTRSVEVCPAPPVRNDFESGLDSTWKATDESAFRLDAERPLAGAQSLRIAYRQSASFITIPMPSVCAVRIAFALRADAMLLETGGVTLARITAGPGTWFHLLLNGSNVSLAQEIRTTTAAGISYSAAPFKLAADTPTAVVVTVDLRTNTTSVVGAPLGQPLPAARPTPMRIDDASKPGPITSVELGAAPGVISEGVGLLWIDDLAIE